MQKLRANSNSFWLSFSLLCAATFSVKAQKIEIAKNLSQYNLEHWGAEEGLPDNAIIHTLFSRDGYLWLVSYGGISRFNGRDFKNYNSYNHPEITNNSFTHIYESEDGTIWASSSGGGLATLKDEVLTIYTTADGLPSNFVEEVIQDLNGKVWVGTSDGLCYFDNGKFKNDGIPDTLKTTRLKSVDIDDSGLLWLATTSDGVLTFDGEKIHEVFTETNGLVSNTVNYIKYDDQRIWVGTEDGLSIISKDRKIQNLTVEDGLPDKVVSTSLVDKKTGAILIGTFKGITRIMNGEFDYPGPGNQLNNNDFTNLINDKEGNIWVSTYRKGLFKLWNGKFTNYSFNRSQISYPYIVHCVLEGPNDIPYIIHELGINVLDIKNNRLKNFDIGYEIVGTKLKHAIWDSKGRLWIGTGEFLLCYENGKVKTYNDQNGLVHDNIRTIFEDKSGNIWAGTNNGISVIDNQGNIKNYTSESGLSHEYIMHFMQDRDGNIIISTRNGLNIFDGKSFKTYHTDNGMAGDFVFKTYQDKEGALWLCGNAGLTRFKNGKFDYVTTNQGLSSNTIFQILEDNSGNFWLTTNQKSITVFRVSKKQLDDVLDGKSSKLNCTEFTEVDGLKSTSATSSGSSLKLKNGLFLFATNEGVELIDPENISKNNLMPPVVIEEFKVDEKVMALDSQLIVPPGKQRITIKFAALSYVASDKLKYKYKLEGFDEKWQVPEGNPETSYTNLPSGKYTFKVQGANSDGVWNEQGASIVFTKKPSFYETPYFIFIITFAILIAGVGIYNYRVKALKKAQKVLSRLVDERTSEILLRKEEIETQKEEIEAQQKEIESKNEELRKINTKLEDIVEQRTDQLKSTYKDLLEVNKELDTFIYRSVHDVRGPIARLQGLSYLISMETKDGKILELVKRLNLTADEMNDVFYRLINIIRLKSSELSITKIELKSLVEEVYKKNSEERKCKVDLKIKVAPDFKLYTDFNNLKLILNQLIDNALKFKSNDNSKISIKATMLSPNVASIRVTDNGLGIQGDVADKIFDMFFVGQDYIQGAGLGLYAVKTAVKVLKGEIKLVSSVRGDTTFEINLPSNA